MFQSLYKYLILNSKAALPGIGFFYVRRVPAYLYFSKKTFIAPSAQVAFAESTIVSDLKFCSFLSNEQQIEEQEAIQHFNHFAQTIKENLQSNGRVELPCFGVLSKDATGAVQFQQSPPLNSFYENVAAERTIRQGSDKDIITNANIGHVNNVVTDADSSLQTKDYWWVFAIILAAAAIAAIMYYYQQNGSLR